MQPEGRLRTLARFGKQDIRDNGSRTGSVDAVWIDPTLRQCRSDQWLKQALLAAAKAAGEEGLIYITAPPLCRGRVLRAAEAAGLSHKAPMALLRGSRGQEVLIPLRASALPLLLSEFLPFGIGRAAAWLGLSEVSTLVAREIVPAVGLVSYKISGQEQLPWVACALRNAGHEGPVDLLITESWRGAAGSLIVHLIDRRGKRLLIAKIDAAVSSNLVKESDNLIRLGPAASAAGAIVPDVLGVCHFADRHISLLSVVEGQKAASHVVNSPQRAMRILETLSAWLERWSVATKTPGTIDEHAVTGELLDKAAALEKKNTISKAYFAWFSQFCRNQWGMSLPRVASHNDLTTHNLLLHGASLGIVDWEGGREQGLPLVDFDYAAVDLVAGINGHRDRAQAWSDCFIEGGRFFSPVTEHRQRLANRLGLKAEAAALCTHACWIEHAFNEQEREPEGSRPFRSILRQLGEQAMQNVV